jgi:pyridoxamine 5'-phosphate oxidase
LVIMDLKDLKSDPFQQFADWFGEAVSTRQPQANAMTLATVDEKNHPHARMVLLKDHGPEGFSFFTNYESNKSHNLDARPFAAIVFYWPGLNLQIRIEGDVVKASAEASDAYFKTRARESQIGAWASPQSRELPDRETLEKNVKDFEKKFAGQNVPRPANWGGYVIKPKSFEFWKDQSNRLHDRFLYEKLTDKSWKISRLSP